MHLRDFLYRQGERPRIAAFAREFGVSHSTVLRWCDGTAMPSADNLVEIHRLTDGAVTPNDMVLTEAPERAA